MEFSNTHAVCVHGNTGYRLLSLSVEAHIVISLAWTSLYSTRQKAVPYLCFWRNCFFFLMNVYHVIYHVFDLLTFSQKLFH